MTPDKLTYRMIIIFDLIEFLRGQPPHGLAALIIVIAMRSIQEGDSISVGKEARIFPCASTITGHGKIFCGDPNLRMYDCRVKAFRSKYHVSRQLNLVVKANSLVP